MKQIATFKQVDDVLHYDDDTGLLIRKRRTSKSVYVGDIAGTTRVDDYIVVRVNGRMHKAHHVVWLLKTQNWPNGNLDHIDGDISNNRIENLREADHRMNARNQKLRSTNKSGVCGVCWESQKKRWRATINGENGKENIGHFINKSDAIAARRAREIEFGYHPNHGRVMGDSK
jgi:hypothetical protein